MTSPSTYSVNLQQMEQSGKLLEEMIIKLLRLREETERFHTFYTNHLTLISNQQNNPNLSKLFLALGACGTQMNALTHENIIDRIEPAILRVLGQLQDWGIVPMKRLLEDRDKAIKKGDRLQKEYDGIKGKTEKEKKLRSLNDQKRRIENVEQLITFHRREFENFWNTKMTKIVEELARSQAFYHTKGLEQYATICKAVAEFSISNEQTSTPSVTPIE